MIFGFTHAVLDELSGGASNSRLASLLDLALEDDLVALLPHLGDDGLAGDDGASEAHLDVLDGAELVVDGLAGDTEGAEAVQDGSLEATHLGKRGVHVQRVVVTAQAVDGGLVQRHGLLGNVVGSASRGLVGSRGSAAVTTLLLAVEATGAAEEDGHLVVENVLTGLGVLGGDTSADNGGVALVNNLEQLAARDQSAASRDGVLADLEVLLAVEKHHGVEVGHDSVVAERHLRREGRDNAEGGKKLEVLGTLKDVVELLGLGTDTDVVEDRVTLLKLELGRIALLVERLADGSQVLVRGAALHRNKDISLLQNSFTFLGLNSVYVQLVDVNMRKT